jgi:predicted Ser/Thr protein kinase
MGLEKLGEGFYGTAYRAEYQGTPVVVKVRKTKHRQTQTNT